jgi:NRPS condensation-like uncharacterized protein
MENEVIRRLSRQEVLYDSEVQNGNFILSHLFLVRVNNKISIEMLKQACNFWVKRHPFLRAKIQRNSENSNERFFVHMAQSDAFTFNNVEMLEEHSPGSTLKQVMDKDAVELFDLSKGPLWRIKWVKLEGADESLVTANHALVLTVQHTIGDGRNIYEIGLQLLKIIANLLENTNKKCVEMDENCVEHSLNSNEELAEQKQIQFEHEIIDHDTRNRNPALFAGHVDNPKGRFQYVCLEPAKMKKLITAVKTRSKNSKLTSVLGTVLSLAWRNIFKRLGVEDPLINFSTLF